MNKKLRGHLKSVLPSKQDFSKSYMKKGLQ